MASCKKCGKSVGSEARYCSQCGAPVSEPDATGAPVLPDNVVALLCYSLTFISGVIFLNLDPYRRDRVMRFHAWQAIIFGLLWVAFSILEKIILHVFPFLWFLMPLVHIALFVLWILFMVKAYNAEPFRLPVLADLAEQQAAREFGGK